ncbi:MAG: hypothetical protein IJF40_02320 [Clostridia bacterium]|nr:hypothetical protein [Clostridia bacterium]
MSISVNGFGENVLTFKAAGGLTSGVPVKVSANDTVAACAASNIFCGVAVEVSGGYAGVQLTGFVTLPYTGTAPTVGLTALSANGNGGVKADSNGNKYLVTNVNTTASTVSFML